MRRMALLSPVLFLAVLTAAAQDQPKPEYVGSEQCARCHMPAETGDPYVKWLRSRHALAYWRLATDWSKFLASRRETYRDVEEPIQEERCLMCHHTGAQDPNTGRAPTFRKEEGVGCEACHGPGSEYMALSVMKDRAQFLAKGGVIPDEQVCKKCHRDDRFRYEEWVKKIDHSEEAGKADPHR